MVYGTLLDRDGLPIDRILAVAARAPNTYTGEDTAELHCHGSPAVLAEGLLALFRQRVRQALPGEFTKRAFLNGRMDLIQAEAVADLIDAESAAAARNAAAQLGGAASRKITGIYSRLLDLIAHFHAVVDYPDEEIDPFLPESCLPALEADIQALQTLEQSFDRGRLLTEGIKTAIVGRPNAGKSSLLNALLGYDRAITSSIPGTTRDTIEEKAVLDGVLLRLIDTAGLRETKDTIEQLGVERTRAALREAELALVVLDGSEPLRTEDHIVMEEAVAVPRSIAVVNKSDLPLVLDLDFVRARFSNVCVVSALDSAGISTLSAEIARILDGNTPPPAGEILTNEGRRKRLHARGRVFAPRRTAYATASPRTPPSPISRRRLPP
jgi:tRNA modification GTPase